MDTTHNPNSRSFSPPDSKVLAQALDSALDAASGPDPCGHRIARVVCTVLAAAVRDALTDFDPDGAFDAVALELMLNRYGDATTSGRFWRADGTESAITDPVWLFDVGEWTPYLTGASSSTWRELCSPLASPEASVSRCRLDLLRAARLQ